MKEGSSKGSRESEGKRRKGEKEGKRRKGNTKLFDKNIITIIKGAGKEGEVRGVRKTDHFIEANIEYFDGFRREVQKRSKVKFE